MHKYEEKTVKTERIFSGKVISLQVEDVLLPNGSTSKREIVRHPGAVGIIALTEDGKMVMVEQYRKALGRELLEIPAGKLEPGEHPEETAKRELEEETGYIAENWSFVQSFYTSPGFADEIIHVFAATGLRKSDHPKECDEDEFVDIEELTLEQVEECVANGRIFDAKTLYGVQYMQLQQKNSKR